VSIEFNWTAPPHLTLTRDIEAFERKMELRKDVVARILADQTKKWMQERAIWKDRTGDARRELFGLVDHVSRDVVEVYFGQGVDYGIYLEVRHGGNFAIIRPALEQFVIPTLERLMAQPGGLSEAFK
jgi:hypothetical protein